jgi:hypothetical protein
MRDGVLTAAADDLDDEQAQEQLTHAARQRQRKENELIWALYRLTDRTQTECAEAAISEPERRPKQSQVSRIVSSVEEEVLSYSAHFPVDSADDAAEAQSRARERGQTHGVLETTPEETKTLPEGTYEAWLDWQARIILQREAFRTLAEPWRELPEWADEVLPEDVAAKASDMRAELWDSAQWLDDADLTRANDVAAAQER